jgi:hypothetical protein
VNPQDPKVSNLINSLTDDQDQRQDLWVHYLTNCSSASLESHLEKIKIEEMLDREFRTQLWDAFKNPPSSKFSELLSHLSEVEQSVACLLALGLSVSDVSRYKRIAEIRIRQVISVMRENDCWKELYAEEKANRRRTSRSQ